MENTAQVLFEDDTPHWYIALGDRWVGPLAASDVYQKILDQEISWAHFVWKPGQANWERICDVKTFQAAVPAAPGKAMQTQIKAAAKPVVKQAGPRGSAPQAKAKKVSEPKIWYLHYNDSQFGPFSTDEINRFLSIGKIHGKVYAWKDGMQDWERLERLGLFDEAVEQAKKVRAAKKGQKPAEEKKSPISQVRDQRAAPRRPLVAKIVMANEDSVIVAVCRDISIGGMQVLTDRIPGVTGTRIKLNVSPSGGIEPFVAEGVIVRILEDGRGFSFRFERLPDGAKRAIESYIASTAL